MTVQLVWVINLHETKPVRILISALNALVCNGLQRLTQAALPALRQTYYRYLMCNAHSVL